MKVSLHSSIPICGIFLHQIPFLIHISCLYHSVAPHNPCSFLSSLLILHYLQTDLCNCLLLLSCHLHILKTLSVPKLIPVVLFFSFSSIPNFHPLLLFSFALLSSSLPSSSLTFRSFQSSKVFQFT